MNTIELQEVPYSWAYFKDTLPELAWKDKDNLLLIIGKLPRLNNTYTQLNQNWDKQDYYACTIYASVLAIVSIFDCTESVAKDLIRRVVARAIEKNQFNPTWGAYTINSAETTCEVWNELNPENKVTLYSTTIGSSMMNTLLNRNYNLIATYITSKEYSIDSSDWVLDWTSFRWSNGGHCIRFASTEDVKYNSQLVENITVLDNYIKDGKYKRYNIPRKNMLSHLQSNWGSYYPKVYFYLPNKLIETYGK